jgi:hypothetical protein
MKVQHEHHLYTIWIFCQLLCLSEVQDIGWGCVSGRQWCISPVQLRARVSLECHQHIWYELFNTWEVLFCQLYKQVECDVLGFNELRAKHDIHLNQHLSTGHKWFACWFYNIRVDLNFIKLLKVTFITQIHVCYFTPIFISYCRGCKTKPIA